MRSTWCGIALVILNGFGPREAERPQGSTPDDFGNRVVAFARERLGKKVGDGKCAGLVEAALAAAGAETKPGREETGERRYGIPVPSAKEARPGDIIEFSQVVFSGKRKVIRNGKTRNHVWRTSYAKHMAVIAEVREGGRLLVLLHQNVGPTDVPASEREVVQETTLDLRTQRPGGTIRISRPIAAESVSRIEWPGKT